jgi:hypothetical protein
MRDMTKNTMNEEKYARCIEVSKRIRWDIDEDVIRGRSLDSTKMFLPNGLTGVQYLDFLNSLDQQLFSQVQGRTYANMFGLVERFINTKILELQQNHSLGSQVALEALVRFSDEEIKHQELFRRINKLAAEVMPDGYAFLPKPNQIAEIILSKSTWAVLGLTSVIELFTQSHYRHSIEPEQDICPLFKDVFLFHWREESQHAILDELEWRQHDISMTFNSRDAAVTDLIELVIAVDGILQIQAESDTRYFVKASGQSFYEENIEKLGQVFLEAYRYQYILSGALLPHFQGILGDLLQPQQLQRVVEAVGTLMPTDPARDWMAQAA